MSRKLLSIFITLILLIAAGAIFYLRVNETSQASTKINDAGNPGAIVGGARQTVRTSAGVLYSFINTAGTCGIWKSTDGTSWTEADSAHHPLCYTGSGIGIAIDSTNLIHAVYIETTNHYIVDYNTFNTSTDLWGTSEVVMTKGAATTNNTAQIAVDSSNKPHVLVENGSAGGESLLYANKVSGSWVSLIGPFTVGQISLASYSLLIDKDDKPEVVDIIDDTTGSGVIQAEAWVGNLNNATSFTQKVLDTSINNTANQRGISAGVDPSGNTWVAYVDSTGTNNINLIKHIYGDAWTTWQTAVTNTDKGCEPSVAINRSDVYIYYTACSGAGTTGNIDYDRYNGSWIGQTVAQTGTFQDVHTKWSYLNDNKATTQIDYLFSDATDISWDKLSLSASPRINDADNPGALGNSGVRPIIRTSSGTLYTFIKGGSTTCKIFKSTDGITWTEQDSAHRPSCDITLNHMPTLAIDSTDTIHIAYEDSATAGKINYNTFNTSTDTYGTAEIAMSACLSGVPSGDSPLGLSISIDSSNKPHVVCSAADPLGPSFQVRYTNRISGSWKSPVSVFSTSSLITIYSEMTIDKDDKPEVVYQNGSNLIIAIGDVNNATTFSTTKTISSTNANGLSIAVDSSGNTYVAYQKNTTNFITIDKHNYGDAWTTWQTEATDSNTGAFPSLATNSTDVYVFYSAGTGSTGNIVYDKYTGTWGGQTTLQTGAFARPKVKNSYLNNNQGSNQIDYLFDDGTDIYWDDLIIFVATPTNTPTPTPTPIPGVILRGGTTIRGGTKIQ